MKNNSFLSNHELTEMGFKFIGKNPLISRYANFYDASNIEIGDNCRIDDFCIFSGHIKLGSNVHISAYTILYGKFGIEFENYTGASARCTIYSAMDDFSGNYMIGPTIDPSNTNVSGGKVTIKEFAQIGANSIIFPNVIINEGCVIGALSLVNQSTIPWHIYAGIPVKIIKERSQTMKIIANKIQQ